MVEQIVDHIDDEQEFWKSVDEGLNDTLPVIDEALSHRNIPISERPYEAYKLVQGMMLEVSDYSAFLQSSVYGRFLVIVRDWYLRRYGDAVEVDKNGFVAAVLVHNTPFIMKVPRYFNTTDEDPSCVWIGFPASVQVEENPLEWIQQSDVVAGLSGGELNQVRRSAMHVANLVRSVGFDVWRLESDENAIIADLGRSIRGNLQSSARSLCERDEGSLRSSASMASQATEKALKVFAKRKGKDAPFIHDLFELATLAEKLGSRQIDRTELASIPSGKEASSIRYEGRIALTDAVNAYNAALSIVSRLVFDAKPHEKFNARNARFKMKRPTWFDFDVEAFRKSISRNA